MPDYAWNEGFTVNIYELSSEMKADIPDPKNIGMHATNVTAKSGKDSKEVTVDGNVLEWSVKVLGKKLASVNGGSISSEDDFGNSLIKVHKTGKGTVLIFWLSGSYYEIYESAPII
jgi:hypothetical protein